MRIPVSKTKRVFSLVIGTLLIILPSILTAGKQLPVETNLLWEREYIYVAPSDFDKDSTDELIVIQSDIDIQPKDQNLNASIASRVFEKNTFKPDNSPRCGGFDETHMWATHKRRDSAFLYDIWPKRELFVTTGIDIAMPRGWDGRVTQVELSEINADRRLEAVVLVGTGWDLKPRGVFVLDWETGKLLWKFLCGPVIGAFILRDIDGDGNQEILCNTAAAGNGNVDNGMADWISYVFILNADGKIRWSRPIGRYSSTALVRWLENHKTGTLQILVVEWGCNAGKRVCDSIFILDAFTGQVVARAQYGKFNGGFTVVNERKGQPIIIIGGTDDTLRILDENLKLIRKHFVNGGGCLEMASGRFTGRKEPEIAVSTTCGQLYLYDIQLKLLSRFPIRVINQLLSLKWKNKERLLIGFWRENQQVWQLLEFNKIPLLNRGIPVATVLVGAFGFLLLFAVTMVYARYQRTRDIRMVIRGLTGQGGVIELNHKGEVTNINNNAREILGLVDKKEKLTLSKLLTIKQLGSVIELAKFILSESSAPQSQETVVSLSQDKYYLVKCVRVKKGVLITFEDISAVEYMKRVTSWAPVAQKLAHGIKNPLSTILGAVEQMEIKCVENGVKKYIGYVKDEVTKLKKMADAFMRFTKLSTPALESKNINEIIKKAMAKYEPLTLPSPTRGEVNAQAGIKVEYELDEKLPLIQLDEEGILSALSIIIENAIEAMKNGGILQIRTLSEERIEKEELKRYVRIEISDTGSGIPEKYLDKVFDPYFTYNKTLGTGLGLSLAKKIIEDHKGFVEIHSKENVGTQVNIYLPLL